MASSVSPKAGFCTSNAVYYYYYYYYYYHYYHHCALGTVTHASY